MLLGMSLCPWCSGTGSVVEINVADFYINPVLGQKFLVAAIGDKLGLSELLKVFVALPELLVVVRGLEASYLIEDSEVSSVVLGAK